MSRSIKKNSIYSILKTITSLVFPLVTFPYITRVLLPEKVGRLNFGLSIVSYFSLIASLGISTYAIRECSGVREDKSKLEKTASEIFSINVITTIIAYLLLIITLLFYSKLSDYRFLILLQSLSIIATTLGTDWLNSAMEDFRYIAIRTVIFQCISLALTFIFIHKPDDYLIYAIISLVSSAGASVSNIWYRKRYCRVYFVFGINWKIHLKPILYLFVMLLAQTIFSSVDLTMLGLIQGDYEVGIYSAAHKILNILNQMIGALLWVIMPRMSFFFSENNFTEINKLLRKILQFNITIGLPCVVGVILLSDDIIFLVAGDSFYESSIVLSILMIGFLFSLFGGSFLGNAILLPSKNEKYYMVVCCITAIVNVVLNYCVIPLLGARGAALTTTICSLLIFILLCFKVDKRIFIPQKSKLFISPVVGCFFIFFICLSMKVIVTLWIRITVSVSLSVFGYFIIQVLLGNELVKETLSMVIQRLKR